MLRQHIFHRVKSLKSGGVFPPPSCRSLFHIYSTLICIPSRYSGLIVPNVWQVYYGFCFPRSPFLHISRNAAPPPKKKLSDNFCSPLIDFVGVLLEVCLSNDW